MNNQRLKTIAEKQQYHILPIRSGMQLELYEKVGDDKNQRIWKFKGLVLKVKRPNHVDGTFTIRGKTSGMTIEKIYPLSFLAFDKVLLLDSFKVRRAKLYFLRDKVGKDARLKSLITSDERGMDLLVLAKESLQVQEEILDAPQDGIWIEPEVVSTETVEEAVSDTYEDGHDMVTQETQELTQEETLVEEVAAEEVVTPQAVIEEIATEVVEEEVPSLPQEEVNLVEGEKSDVVSSDGDDLAAIDGIGEAFKNRLNTLGIITFADLVALTDERIAELEESDSMTSLEEWHNWIQQAKAKLA